MAGDWIKMRESLHEDPAILAMADELETRPEHVVGYCHRFWSWVSRNCPDGTVHGVTVASVEAVLNMPGFLSMMQNVGWLDVVENDGKPCLVIPKFDRHLSQGAKSRGLAAERKRHGRVPKVSRSQRDKSVTREEKRREENISNERTNGRASEIADEFRIAQIDIGDTQWKAMAHLMKRIAQVVTKRADVSARHLREPDYELCARAAAIATYHLSLAWLDPVLRSISARRDPADNPWAHFRSLLIAASESRGHKFHDLESLVDVPKRGPAPAPRSLT